MDAAFDFGEAYRFGNGTRIERSGESERGPPQLPPSLFEFLPLGAGRDMRIRSASINHGKQSSLLDFSSRMLPHLPPDLPDLGESGFQNEQVVAAA